MAKALQVVYRDRDFALSLEKVDRSKLYGYVDIEVMDEQGRRCELATLAGDGHTLVGKGGTGYAHLSPTGLWREKAALKAVDLAGKPITPVKSTFDAPVHLDKKTTIEDYLNHNIHLVYHLTPENPGDDISPLVDELRSGIIYTFPFSYRGGLESQTAFLLTGADGNIFLVVGTPASLNFVGLKQAAGIVDEEEGAAEEEDESMDFGMM